MEKIVFNVSKENMHATMGLDKEKTELVKKELELVMNNDDKTNFDVIKKAIEISKSKEELVYFIYMIGHHHGIDSICDSCPMALLHESSEKSEN